MKKYLSFFLFLTLILFSKIFIKNEIIVFDITNQYITDEFIIRVPIVSVLFEPFVGPIRYTCMIFRTPYDFVWIPIIYTILMSLIIKNFILSIIYAISLMLVFSYPFNIYLQTKLIPRDKDYFLVDFHSHTRFSHDALATIKQNFKFHSACGHDFFSITDHDNPSAYFIAKSKYKSQAIIPGLELTDSFGNHILVYGENAILNVKKFEHPKDVIRKVKMLNGMTILAEAWELKDKIKDYINYGIDGLEIYSFRSNPPDESVINEIVKSYKNKNLILLAGTNFHGYGYANIYTAIPKDSVVNPEKLISFLRENRFAVRILRLRDRFICEGKSIFFAPLGYFSSLEKFQVLSWIIWLIILSFFQYFKKIVRVIMLICLSYCLANLLITATPFTFSFAGLIIVLLILNFIFF